MLDMVGEACSLSIGETGKMININPRLAWSTQRVPGNGYIISYCFKNLPQTKPNTIPIK